VFPYFEDPTKALFCVFDGHAGRSCAVSCTTKVPQFLKEEIGDQKLTDLTEVWKKVYQRADSELTEFEYEGCTSTTVFIWQVGESRYLQCANVGDSTAFLKRKDTVLKLSYDHKASDEGERDRIAVGGNLMNEGQTRVGGLAVSRALGDHFLKQEKLGVIAEPYISECIKLEDTDTLLVLASDGLWDVMDGFDAMNTIEGMGVDADEMAKHLMTTAMEKSKCTDNITVLVAIL